MKHLNQQTRFDFPLTTIKFLFMNYSSINKYIWKYIIHSYQTKKS